VKIVCPKCSQQIPADGVNVAQGIAFCKLCAEAFSIGTLVRNEPARLAQPENTKVVLTRAGDKIAVALPRGGFRGAGCFFTFFSLIWNGITWPIFIANLLGLVKTQNSSGNMVAQGFDVFVALFLIPFILVGLVTFCAALYCIYGEVTLAMDREQVLFQRQVFGWKWERTYPLADITDIRLTEAYKQNDEPVYGVGIHLSSKRMPLTFGSNLSDEEKNWLVGELNAFWRERGSGAKMRTA
jgi:hypothetical protein